MLPSALLRDRKTVLLRRGVPIALGGVLITGTGMAWADHGAAAPDYRTALASVGSVDQLITLTGTVAKLTQEDASFGVSGVVSKVEVASGDTVSKGDVLAKLDPSDLDAAVTAAEATLARAKASLETDEAAADSSSRSSSSSGKGNAGKGGAGTGSPTAPGGLDLAAPTKAVIDAMAKATTDLAKVTDAVNARDAACDSVFAGDSTPSPEPTASPDPTPESTASSNSTPTTDELQACIAAMKNVSDLQDQVATDQAGVQTSEQALSTAIDLAVKTLAAQTKAAADAAEKAADAAKNAGGGGRQQTVDPVDQAARVAVDNAAILAAQAALDSAKEDVNEAVLTAPIDGVVGTVGLTKGATAATSDVITILGNGAVKVTLDVPSATALKLKKGMAAQVTADGASAPSTGTVDSVGILPTTANGSSTYPVVIVVPNPADGLAEGAAATVAITLKAVNNVVTVPNSAVTATGSGASSYVLLLENGKPTRQTVTTGAVGATVTEIATGVTAGQSVVLADPSADVPASSTTANNNRRGVTFGGGANAGGFSGAGTFTGGAAGGGGNNRRGG